ncbi:hypothetical protein [Bartonella sp. MM73XJBT]|nr:hypothetical protein [Bartonella sp. MM73XJBT]
MKKTRALFQALRARSRARPILIPHETLDILGFTQPIKLFHHMLL